MQLVETPEVPLKKEKVFLPLRIYIEGEITEKTQLDFIQIIYGRAPLHKEIEIYVNSPGGLCSAAMAIVNLISVINSTHHVSTIGISSVMSSAVDIFMAANNRYAYRNCRWMQHYPSASIHNANVTDLEHLYGELDRDLQWGLLNNTRDSLLTPMQLMGHILESRNNEFFFDYEFAKEHLLVNRDGIPPITKGRHFIITGTEDDEDC